MKALTQYETKLEEIRAATHQGIEAFERAGRLIVELLDEDPEARAKLINDGFRESALETYERIGRKQLYYKLCLSDAPGIRALRQCPYSEQVKYLEEPIDFLVSADGKWEPLKVMATAMSKDQAKQAIGRRIRNLGEQRAYLESRKAKPQNIVMNRPYTVRGGTITFHEPCKLTIQQLHLLLAEATA